MALEETVNAIEDHLIEGLSFKLKPTAAYVQSRRSVSYYPQGGNDYTSNGVRVIKISLTGGQGEWIDPSTLCVHYTVNNKPETAGQVLHFLSGPWCVFRRMRVMAGGVCLEYIDQFSRVSEMFHLLSSSAKRANANILGFNTASVDKLYDLGKRFPMSSEGYDYDGINISKSVMFTPLCGLISQEKYLPLRYMGGLTLEFELVQDPTECLITAQYIIPQSTTTSDDPDTPGATITTHTPTKNVITNAQMFKNWSLSDVQIKCDVVTIDNNLNNEYVKYLLGGNALAINYNTFVTQMQTVVGQQNSVNITRSFTRFNEYFCKPCGNTWR
jgi:hypothetical protein